MPLYWTRICSLENFWDQDEEGEWAEEDGEEEEEGEEEEGNIDVAADMRRLAVYQETWFCESGADAFLQVGCPAVSFEEPCTLDSVSCRASNKCAYESFHR